MAWEDETWMVGLILSERHDIATVAFDAEPGSIQASAEGDGSTRDVERGREIREPGWARFKFCHTQLIRCRRGVGSQIGSRCGSRRPYAVVHSC
jgi:hypothetical protein